MDWVVDCSIALALCLPDEHSERAEYFFNEARRAVFWVPSLWWYEIANAIGVARKRKRLDEAEVVQILEQLGVLPFRTDLPIGFDTVRRLYALSQDYELSCYDVAYLELAQRRQLGLATVDRRLNAAARDAGLKTVGITPG
jgi:predicted nucleic acid-binding protein